MTFTLMGRCAASGSPITGADGVGDDDEVTAHDRQSSISPRIGVIRQTARPSGDADTDELLTRAVRGRLPYITRRIARSRRRPRLLNPGTRRKQRR